MKLDKYLKEFKLHNGELYYKDILMTRNDKYFYKNSDISKKYNEVLDNEVELLNKLVDNNDINTYYSVYYYLLWNGYLSVDNSFIFNTKSKEIDSNLGLSIANGEGCCRNISIHYNNLMNRLFNDDRFKLVGTKYKKERPTIEVEEIKKYSKAENFINKETNKYLSNHAESLDSKNNIIYDPCRFNIQFINYDNIDEDNYNGLFDLGLESVYGINESFNERINNLDKRLDKSILFAYAKKENMSYKDLMKLLRQGIEICLDNKNILKEHSEKTNETYQYIKKNI